MINILFLAAFPIHPISGGVQRVTDILSKEFEDLGHNVFYLSLKGDKKDNFNEPRQFWLSDVIGELKNNSNNLIKWIISKDIDVVINQAGIYKEISDIVEKVNNNGIKIVTVHHNCVWCLNERYREIRMGNAGDSYFWRLVDKPVVWNILRFLNRKKYGQLFKRAIDVSNKLILLSPSFIPELEKYGIEPRSEDVTAIPNPAPFPQVFEALDGKENRILYVGRLTIPQKRVDRLLKIWEELHFSHPDWEFDIVGDGSAREWMQEYCRLKNLVRIHFHGRGNPKPFLRKAKIFTLTSDFEGYGMVLVEAQAYGVVPITFNCFSSVSEILSNGEAGFIIDDFNLDNFISETKLLMLNDDRREFIAKQAIKSIERYKPNEIAKCWINLINKI